MSGLPKVKGPNLNLQERVFTGNFPKAALSKMNRPRLERFVLQLVESTSGVSANEAQDFEGLCRRLFLKEVDKPQWWPSDQIIFRTITPDGRYLMDLLKFLVYKCCEFFKKPKENLNTEVFVTQVDESLRRSKRKLHSLHSAESYDSEFTPAKRRRTLLPRNYSAQVNKKNSEILSQIKSPVINLQDILYKPKSLDQGQFLKLFKLKSISSPITENLSGLPWTSYSSVKFNMCTHIPFSSDLGMELMRRDNHTCPEITKTRKLDRLEWHLNKPSMNPEPASSFPVSYQEKKNTTFHTYKMPKRQHYQQPGQFYYEEIEDWHRRHLTVSVVCDNLKQLQKTHGKKSNSKLQVVLSRITQKRKLNGKSLNKKKKKKRGKAKLWSRRKKSTKSTKRVN